MAVVRNICSERTNYGNEIRGASRAKQLNCLCISQQVFDCTGRNGWYQGNDPNCRLAFYCNAGLTYQHSCPVELRWNPLSVSCESPDRVPCGSDSHGSPDNAQQPMVPVTNRPYIPRPGGGNYGVPTLNTYAPNFPQTSRPLRPGLGVASTYPSIPLTTSPTGYGDFGSTQGDISTNPGLGIVTIQYIAKSGLAIYCGKSSSFLLMFGAFFCLVGLQL